MTRLTFLAILVALSPYLVSADVCEEAHGVRCSASQYCDDVTEYCLTKKNLGESCPKLGSCLTGNAECLGAEGSKTCQCRPETHVDGQNGQCVPKCTVDRDCTGTTQFCNTLLGGCLPKVDLNEDCGGSPTDNACLTDNASCTDNKCQCVNDFLEPPSSGKCIQSCTVNPSVCTWSEYCDTTQLCKSKVPLGQPCTDVVHCVTQDAECNQDSQTCDCPADYVNYYGSSCIKRCDDNDSPCSATEYCNQKEEICFPKANLHQTCDPGSVGPCAYDNQECATANERSTCECKANFGEENGQCIAACTPEGCEPSGQFCNSDKLCEPKRPLGQSCSAAGAHEECTEDLECAGAISPRCSCPTDKIEDKGRCLDKCTTNAFCTTEYDSNHYCSVASGGRCILKGGLNGWCDMGGSGQCRDPLTSCSSGQCLCNEGLVPSGSSCIARCTTDGCSDQQFCHSVSGLCTPKVSLEQECNAAAGSGQCQDTNAECQKPSEEEEEKCTCNTNFGPKNGVCAPKCSSSATCATNEYCDVEGTSLCWDKTNLNQNCKYPDQCATTGATCADDKCSCQTDRIEWFGTCVTSCATAGCKESEFCGSNGICSNKKNIGQSCAATEECVASTICDGVCKCDTDSYESGKVCILKCTMDNGCNLLNEYCESIAGRCYPLLGPNFGCRDTYQCTNRTTCEPLPEGARSSCLCVENSSANGNECDCNQGFIESLRDLKKCLQVASGIGATCEEDGQCTHIGAGDVEAACHPDDLTCLCNEGFVGSLDVQRCLKIATSLTDVCEEDAQCTNIGDGIAEATCASGKCACKNNFEAASDNKSCKVKANANSGATIQVSLIAIMTISLVKYFL